MRIILITLLLFSFVCNAQFDSRYDRDMLSSSFHKERREALREKMGPNSVAIFFSAPTRNRANDVDYLYHQDPDFYYLSGLMEPNSVLLIFKEEQTFNGLKVNEVLFVQPNNKNAEAWTGRRLGTEGAKQLLKYSCVLENTEFLKFTVDYKKSSKVYINTLFEDAANDQYNQSDLHDLQEAFKSQTTGLNNVDTETLWKTLTILREQKQPEEIVLMRKAIDITCESLKETMKQVNDSSYEYQIQAMIEYGFRKRGSEYPGYPSIIGAGENSCILHYITNRKKGKLGELVVCDVGAEYHNYTADVTRTFPLKGKFTEEQKLIYNIVLLAQKAGIEACKKDSLFSLPGKIASTIVANELLKLGIIKKVEDYRTYFFHGTSHDLGLDVHDGRLSPRLGLGHIITVEPGIYIPEGSDCDPKWWNIGVRIEDDILITDAEPEILSSCVPKEIAEIESIMAH